jgi:hypothetical protein
LLLITLNSHLATAHAQGTAFTYQGRLNASGAPASGSYDLVFTLYTTNTTGVAIAGPATNSAVTVTNGLFTTLVDFGPGVFTDTSNWLAIAVSTNGANTFSLLTPRQQVTPTPYALYAANAMTAASASSVPAADVTGTLGLGHLPSAVITNSATSVSLSGTFTGNGGGLTNIADWHLSGNTGTTNGNYVGTTDNQPLEISVGGVRAGLIIPSNGSPNIIFGSAQNSVSNTTAGASILGGNNNTIGMNSSYSVIGSGVNNTIQTNASLTVIGGGLGNSLQINAQASVIGGGVDNTVQANADYSFIGGGQINFAGSSYATVGGGYGNVASGPGAVVGGGGFDGNNNNNPYGNTASGAASVVAGGVANTASGPGAFIGGGGYDGANLSGNTASGDASVIGGGTGNTASGDYATVGGGVDNTASGSTYGSSVVGGGQVNIASGDLATVGGGYNNLASGIGAFIGGGGFDGSTLHGNTASGIASVTSGGLDNWANGNFASVAGGAYNYAALAYSTVPGGFKNIAGGLYSFAAGQQAQAMNSGAFVWADSQNAVFASTASDQFLLRAQGGVGINTASTPDSDFCINTNTYLFSHAIYLRGDTGADHNHGLAYCGPGVTNFAATVLPDGPVLWGYSGGALGVMRGGAHAVLTWTNGGVWVTGGFSYSSDRNHEGELRGCQRAGGFGPRDGAATDELGLYQRRFGAAHRPDGAGFPRRLQGQWRRRHAHQRGR